MKAPKYFVETPQQASDVRRPMMYSDIPQFFKWLKDRVRNGQPHVYLSTYCLHDDHANCRLKCKVCKAPCVCPCHLPEKDGAA